MPELKLYFNQSLILIHHILIFIVLFGLILHLFYQVKLRQFLSQNLMTLKYFKVQISIKQTSIFSELPLLSFEV